MAKQYFHVFLAFALLLFGIVSILLLTIPIGDLTAPPEFMYGIVLDAGSSHTSMYIYKWPADKQNDTGVVTQHSECHPKGGGISSYAGQQGAAGKSLEDCLNQAMQDIPRARHELTPVYLGATAGMRLLNISSPEHSAQVLQEVGQKIKSYPFKYQGAAILSGQDEGAYGWVTVNYLLENFIKYGFMGRWLSPGRPTVGALDFGGASIQITFVTKDEVEDAKDRKKLRLYGHDYSLYTHSFLCFGRDQVLKRLLASLVKAQGHTGSVFHPCFPAGYSTTIKMETLFDSPCTVAQKPSSGYNPQAALSVVGSGDYDHCLGNITELFSFSSCPFSKCSFNQVFQPNVSGHFMAFSSFFHVHQFLLSATGIDVTTPAQLEKATRAICNMSINQTLALVPDQRPRLQDFCAASLFTKVLLTRGYRFDEKSFPHISFQNKAGETSVGWALGYMLSLSNLLPAESPGLRKALNPGAWTTLLFLVTLLLITNLLYFALQVFCSKKKICGDTAS
ncbi:ectonucleoside triphosphate diphosphohydrolase 2 isoform X2 [Esox lucius]|uniref:Ectonucleoside triphosphate diphosphohydrolase 2b n=1 Tax=Esox lucius TaxID=8010 RepID=A0A3P8YJH0_ESOLU|nr:ectonucleoside triphosphate diphosphohydrolase 2 isoform X2 [Esox lucius]